MNIPKTNLFSIILDFNLNLISDELAVLVAFSILVSIGLLLFIKTPTKENSLTLFTIFFLFKQIIHSFFLKKINLSILVLINKLVLLIKKPTS